jgi:hypothetical protein
VGRTELQMLQEAKWKGLWIWDLRSDQCCHESKVRRVLKARIRFKIFYELANKTVITTSCI